MSKSRKRTPIVPMTSASSDMRYKRSEHARERAAVRAALQTGEEPPPGKLYGNPALGRKDGKQYVPKLDHARRK